MINLTSDLRLEVSQLLLSKTLKNTGIIFGGSILASVFSLFTILILSRTLGPEIYGVFSLVWSVVLLLIGLTDFGIATALSKFIIPLEIKSSKGAISFFRSVFWIELLLGLITVLLGFIFLAPISNWLGGNYLREPIMIGFIIAGTLSFNAYVPAVLQSLQKFWTIAQINIFSNLFKLLLVIVLFLIGYLTLWSTLFIYLFTSFVTLLIGLLIIPKYFVTKVNLAEDTESVRRLLSFTKWLIISYALNAIAGRLDMLMLSHFRSPAEVGHYALAFQLSLVFPLLLGAISTVLIPKVSALKNQDQLGRYILKSIKTSLFVLPIILISIIFTPPIIKIVFGSKFINSIPTLQILLLNYSLILIVNPISYIMYTLNKQNILTLINAITLISLFILQIYLIPNFGGIGASVALIINSIIAIIILAITIIMLNKQGKIRI